MNVKPIVHAVNATVKRFGLAIRGVLGRIRLKPSADATPVA
jgi:hypothetical protein